MPRPTKPARIEKRSDSGYYFIRDSGGRIATGTKDQAEAEFVLARYLAAKNKLPEGPTVADLLARRLGSVEGRGVARASNTKYYHAPLHEHLGQFYPDELSEPAIDAYHKKRAHVPGSLREELFELRSALRAVPNSPFIKLPPKRAAKELFLTQAQAQDLLSAAHAAHIKLFILIAMVSGHRAGAILGLTWNRVDMDRARIDFNEPGRELTKKRRTVTPIGPTIIAALRDAQQYAETSHVIEYMGRPVKSIKTAFRKAARDADVSWASPHVLKHSVISWLSERGLAVEKISELTATDEKTVKRIYRKFSPDYLSDAADLLDEMVSMRDVGNEQNRHIP